MELLNDRLCADDGAVMVSALPLAFFLILVHTWLELDLPKGTHAHAPEH